MEETPQARPVLPLAYETAPADQPWRTVARFLALAAFVSALLQLQQSGMAFLSDWQRAGIWFAYPGATRTWGVQQILGTTLDLLVLFLNLAMAVSAFACLRFRPWGRRALILTLAAFCAATILRQALVLILISRLNVPLPLWSVTYLLSLLGIAIYPALLIALLTRPDIKRIFDAPRP